MNARERQINWGPPPEALRITKDGPSPGNFSVTTIAEPDDAEEAAAGLADCENAGQFVQLRKKRATVLEREREIVLVVDHIKSNGNLSSIIRTASCFGIQRIIAGGRAKKLERVTRECECELSVQLQVVNTLPYALKRLKKEGYRVVGLEQTTSSQMIYDYKFERRTALVIGNEGTGIKPDSLAVVDDVVEIPIWGLPYSLNVANATSMALYEYCRQYQTG